MDDRNFTHITHLITANLSEAVEKGDLEVALERYTALFLDAAKRLRQSDRPLTPVHNRLLRDVSGFRIPRPPVRVTGDEGRVVCSGEIVSQVFPEARQPVSRNKLQNTH